MNDKEVMRVELQRRIRVCESVIAECKPTEVVQLESYNIKLSTYKSILFFIDNNMQQEPVNDSLQDAADNKAQEAYPVRTKTNKTGTGDYDPNLPRRKAYVKGFVDGYNFRTNKVEDNDTNT